MTNIKLLLMIKLIMILLLQSVCKVQGPVEIKEAGVEVAVEEDGEQQEYVVVSG